MTLQPCLECGELSEQRRCPAHTISTKPSARERGYDKAWDRLSRRARRLQPFCIDCGATTDLQADHSPQAWRRREQGLPIRLEDVDVVCGPCNRRRGAARPWGVGVNRSPGGPDDKAKIQLLTSGRAS